MSNDGADWDRLAQYVIARRTALDMTQIELAQAGGLSLDRVSAVEGRRARSLRPKTIRSLEIGLQWEGGSVQAILAGDVPTVRVPVGTVEQLDPALPVRRIVEGRATAAIGSVASDRHLQPIEGGGESPAPDEFGLGEEPPFPGITTNSSGLNTPEILNRVWEMAKQVESAYYRERDAQGDPKRLRVIQQYELAAKALIEDLGDAG